MKLFTLGPVEMYSRTLKIASQKVPYFRTDEFSRLNLESVSHLKKATGADEDSNVIFLTASGTASMEAVIINCFTMNDKLLIIDGGGFGHRFAIICTHHGIPYESVTLEYGESLSPDMLEKFADNGFTGLLVNIHETSTGQLYDIEMLAEFCKSNNLFFVVDAISSFLADHLNIRDHSIDALILSSQKALSLAPGLSIVVLNKRMYSERVQHIQSNSLYFNFKDYIADGERGQTPYTPAVRILIELNDMLNYITEIGVDAIVANTASIAVDFRNRIAPLGIDIPSFPLSNACTPIIINNGRAKQINSLLIERGIYLNPCGGSLADTVLRVGHIGNLSTSDNAELVQALAEIL
jgi:aspartate aminotransferase-like enzyme